MSMILADKSQITCSDEYGIGWQIMITCLDEHSTDWQWQQSH